MKRWLAGTIAVAGLLLAGTASTSRPEEVAKTVHVRLAIDAQGRVADASLVEKRVPATLEAPVLARVKAWKFDPVIADGMAVPAVTYASFFACAVRSGDGYDLAVHYMDNGPLLTQGQRIQFQPVVEEYSKADQSIKVRIKVLESGKVQLEDVAMVDVEPGVERDLRISVKQWVDGMRYEPEQIGGRPVSTSLEWPLYIWTDNGEEHKKPGQSDPPTPCDAARAMRDTPHPVDSRFKQEDGATAPSLPGHPDP